MIPPTEFDPNATFIAENGIGRIDYGPAHGIVCVTYEGFLNADDFKSLLTLGLDTVEEKGAKYWLANMLNSSVLDNDAAVWTTEVWVPRAFAVGIERISTLMPQNAIGRMQLKRMDKQFAALDADDPRVRLAAIARFYSDVEDALVWLSTGVDRATVPDLARPSAAH